MAAIDKTLKFNVWTKLDKSVKSLNKDQNLVPINIALERKFTLNDVVNVALNRFPVIVDNSVIEAIQECHKKYSKSQYNVNTKNEKTNNNFKIYTEMSTCRAAVFIEIINISQARSGVRPEVLEFLVEMLNLGVSPVFTSIDNAGFELIHILEGKSGFCHTPNGEISVAEMYADYKLNKIKLTDLEITKFSNSSFFLLASSILLVAGISNVVPTLDVIAALSCEALSVDTLIFDPVKYDICRQHRGQSNSSSNLRLMLEGSKRCTENLGSDAKPFEHIPQIHGPIQECINSVTKILEIELNSSEISPSNAFDLSQSNLARKNSLNALNLAVKASIDRLGVLSGDCTNSTSERFDLNEFEIYHPVSFLKSITKTFVSEIEYSLNILNSIEIELLNKSKNEEIAANKNDQNDKKAAKEMSMSSSKKNTSQEEENLSPEALARIEAKRKAKADKAAEKAKAKLEKKTGGSLTLGAGTTLFRSFLNTIKTSLESFIDPFDLSETGFPNFCVKLIEKLGSGGKRKPKIAKGARDFTPEQMKIREQVFATIRRVFKRHGAVEIDTPVFELKEVLTGKYGEDSKLIYDLADQGGELLSLRYDLTVPFARFLAMNSVGNIKRFHIAKVYRRDNPQLTKGRYREFYQCDFDVAGVYTKMVPDAEVITVAKEILSDLPIGSFMIKLNHRKLLDAIFDICGVPTEKFRTICSAVDKLDKMSWEDVKSEMVNEKGLAVEAADKIGKYVLLNGQPMALLNQLFESKTFGDHVDALSALEDLKILFTYLESMNSIGHVSFDLSLARGLDYYTGVIYEVILTDGISQMGSIAAGGRYDRLVGMFSTSGHETPCVGVSIGVERVFAIMEKKALEMGISQTANVQVFIASIGSGYIPQRMKIASMLWKENISAEYSTQEDPKFKKQLDEVLERGIPYMVVFGEAEVLKGVVNIKDMNNHSEEVVPLNELISKLLTLGCAIVPEGADTRFLQKLKSSTS